MSKNKSFLLILIPAATVFLSSACIMVLEIVAGRLIAKTLGTSLYTWTSVIGVVLAGITLGNYLGGRIADRFNPMKALAVLLAVSSATCVEIVILNNLIGEWLWLWKLSWPMHVFAHVCLLFMPPSTMLGTISPVVAKIALDKGLPKGRTIGDIYAFGAAGSIAGTFLAGFYLIAAIGTVVTIWLTGATLMFIALLYRPKFWPLYLWAAIFIVLMNIAIVPESWAMSTAPKLALREKPNPSVIYQDESQYCYISVIRTSKTEDKREFMQDKLTHSRISMNNLLDLQYRYALIYASVTRLASQGKNKLSTLFIGGGGYVFPRYIEILWPGSNIDVVEIDPRVTEAAILAFGLDRNTPINTFTMDARNYIDEMLEKKRAGNQVTQYDFVYGDAFNDYSVPYQLTTKEFNDKIAQILTDDGIYMINLIDIYDSGLFLGAIVNTFQQTFPCVYVVAKYQPHHRRNTFVVIAAMREFVENLRTEKTLTDPDTWILSDAEINTLKEKSRGIVLTDDYAPVENMLTPVVHESANVYLLKKYLIGLRKQKTLGKLDECLAIYEEIIKLDPSMSITVYNSMGEILAEQGKWQKAIDISKKAIEYNEKSPVKHSMSDIYYNISLASKQLGKNEQASEYIQKAIEAYRQDLTQEPNSIKTLRNLSAALTENNQFSEAVERLQQAININPLIAKNHLTLANMLLIQQRYDDAVEVLNKAIIDFSNAGDETTVINLRKYLRLVEADKNANKNKSLHRLSK